LVNLLVWVVVLEIVGIIAFPIGYPLFKQLSDAGFAISKVLGILLGSYIFWIMAILGIFPNSYPGIVIAFTLLALLGWYSYQRHREDIHDFFRNNQRNILTIEAIFFTTFILYGLVRSLNPAINLSTFDTITTEQPMDLMLLKATMTSSSYPPHDSWLSGSVIRYYYFGYLAIGWVGRLSLSSAPFVYNFGLITIFALTFTTVYGTVFNVVTLVNDKTQISQRHGFLAGILGGMLVLVLGNLVGFLAIIRHWGFGGGAFWKWLNIPGLLSPVTNLSILPTDNSWWWRATRIITDGPGANPIDEFPAFSFLLGDLHPHLMSLPFVMLAITTAFALFKRNGSINILWFYKHPISTLLIGLIIGALGFVNSWDLPTYGFLILSTLTLKLLLNNKHNRMSFVRDTLVMLLGFVIMIGLLFAPFFLSFDSQVQGVLPVAQTGTRVVHYILLWGLFLGILLGVNGFVFVVEKGRFPKAGVITATVIGIGPIVIWSILMTFLTLLSSLDFFSDMGVLTESLITASNKNLIWTPDELLGGVAGRWILLSPLIILNIVTVLNVGRLVTNNGDQRLIFGLILGVLGLLVAITAELFFVLDLFGTRMNTVFKLHYQVWLLLSVGSAICLGSIWSSREQKKKAQSNWRSIQYVLMILVGCFSLYSIVASVTQITNSTTGPTLDGLAFHRQNLGAETDAIIWLGKHVTGSSVVLEAQGNDYTDSARVSTISGIPTVLGWLGHEQQWGHPYNNLIQRRQDVDTIYQSEDFSVIRRLLANYDVSHIFIGRLERARYGLDVDARMSEMFPIVYRNESVTIYSTGS
tara:strand:- start:5157 stop:7583 length:2427 start_codon:yes stop_codon:yes gene_type:complete